MATTYRLDCCPAPTNGKAEHKHEGCNPPLPIGEKATRQFDPNQHLQYGPATDPPSSIIFYTAEKQVSYLRHSTVYSPINPKIEEDTLVISIDGKARREGTAAAQAISGRYFGPDSKWNGTTASVRQTAQTAARATIRAAANAVDTASKAVEEHPEIKKVIIMTHRGWLVTHMHGKVWDWLAYEFPPQEQLPSGVTPEEYRLAHRCFRQLEEQGIAVMFWKVSEDDIPEPGRLAIDYLDLLASDPSLQREWETWYDRYLFEMKLRQLILEEGEGGPGIAKLVDEARAVCPCPDCNPEKAAELSHESREAQLQRGEENDCPCDACRAFVRSHALPKKDSAVATTAKENEIPRGDSATQPRATLKEMQPNKQAETELSGPANKVKTEK
jgi:hypothetical protein